MGYYSIVVCLLGKAYFVVKMTGPAMVRLASSDFRKAPPRTFKNSVLAVFHISGRTVGFFPNKQRRNIALEGQGDKNDADSPYYRVQQDCQMSARSPQDFICSRVQPDRQFSGFCSQLGSLGRSLSNHNFFWIKTKDSQVFFENGPTVQPL